MSDPRSNLSLSNPWHLLATGFGSGLSPIVPGTMGTLASVPFYLMLAQLPWILYAVVVVFASLIGIKICQVTSDDMQVHDHGSIVWDEFAGFWITMLIVPLYQLLGFRLEMARDRFCAISLFRYAQTLADQLVG